jgi:hypothetical protein
LSRINSIYLGDNPFFGVDHLSHERARQKASRSQSFDNILEVMKCSLDNGAGGMVASTHTSLEGLIKYATQKHMGVIYEMPFLPIIPYVQRYVTLINEKGFLRTIIGVVTPEADFQSRIRILARGGLGIMKKDFSELFKAFINIELIRVRRLNIKTVFLHDVFTDLALSLNIKNVFQTFQSHLHDEYGVGAGLVTKNFPRLVQKLREWELSFSPIMTSFNEIGFQMNPSKKDCEDSIEKYDGHIIAMSVLAGGYLRPEEALGYLLSLPKVEKVVIGMSSVTHAENIFKIFLAKDR